MILFDGVDTFVLFGGHLDEGKLTLISLSPHLR